MLISIHDQHVVNSSRDCEQVNYSWCAGHHVMNINELLTLVLTQS